VTNFKRVRDLFVLRFVTIYVLLNAIPYAVWIIPAGRRLRELYIDLWFPIVHRFGNLVLNFEVLRPPRGTGSGDTSFDWAYLLLAATFAVLFATVWTRFSANTEANARHELWLRTMLRYALAGNMFAYGLVKFSLYQFPFPGPEQLLLRYGDSSPMMLLWMFMGASPAYGWFVGIVEITGASLLLFRRTTTLGALVLLAALGNIVVLNLAYDVPAKLFAMHLFGTTLFLLWPDRHRLLNLLVLNRATVSVELDSPPALKRLGRARPLLKGAIVALLIAPITWQQVAYVRYLGQPVPELYGAYDVQESAGAEGPAAGATAVTFGRNAMTLWDANGARLTSFRFVSENGRLELLDKDKKSTALSYANRPPMIVEIEGEIGGHRVRWVLQQRETFPLVTHGFHWIAELAHRD
jgi:hypothetical protein